MRFTQKILIAVVGAGLTFCGVAGASAAPWQADHPRRVEVNHRLAHQDLRINRDFHEGRITATQAACLHHEDQFIRHHERRHARCDGGHITRGEQTRLNHQENHISRQIYHDAH